VSHALFENILLSNILKPKMILSSTREEFCFLCQYPVTLSLLTHCIGLLLLNPYTMQFFLLDLEIETNSCTVASGK
jgi:hypothetical protein